MEKIHLQMGGRQRQCVGERPASKADRVDSKPVFPDAR